MAARHEAARKIKIVPVPLEMTTERNDRNSNAQTSPISFEQKEMGDVCALATNVRNQSIAQIARVRKRPGYNAL